MVIQVLSLGTVVEFELDERKYSVVLERFRIQTTTEIVKRLDGQTIENIETSHVFTGFTNGYGHEIEVRVINGDRKQNGTAFLEGRINGVAFSNPLQYNRLDV